MKEKMPQFVSSRESQSALAACILEICFIEQNASPVRAQKRILIEMANRRKIEL